MLYRYIKLKNFFKSEKRQKRGNKMEERLRDEIMSILKDIREKVSAQPFTRLRGPCADPSPIINEHRFGILRDRPWLLRGPVGPVADPSPEYLLDKARLAQLKIHNLDMHIKELNKQIEFCKMERDLLKEEYKIK